MDAPSRTNRVADDSPATFKLSHEDIERYRHEQTVEARLSNMIHAAQRELSTPDAAIFTAHLGIAHAVGICSHDRPLDTFTWFGSVRDLSLRHGYTLMTSSRGSARLVRLGWLIKSQQGDMNQATVWSLGPAAIARQRYTIAARIGRNPTSQLPGVCVTPTLLSPPTPSRRVWAATSDVRADIWWSGKGSGGLGEATRRVFAALPYREPVSVRELAGALGRVPQTIRVRLEILRKYGLAAQRGRSWMIDPALHELDYDEQAAYLQSIADRLACPDANMFRTPGVGVGEVHRRRYALERKRWVSKRASIAGFAARAAQPLDAVADVLHRRIDLETGEAFDDSDTMTEEVIWRCPGRC